MGVSGAVAALYVAAQLYRTVLELAALTGRETVWDLYCGVGTIGLFLAPFADKVFGIEVSAALVTVCLSRRLLIIRITMNYNIPCTSYDALH